MIPVATLKQRGMITFILRKQTIGQSKDQEKYLRQQNKNAYSVYNIFQDFSWRTNTNYGSVIIEPPIGLTSIQFPTDQRLHSKLASILKPLARPMSMRRPKNTPHSSDTKTTDQRHLTL